jgi:hypothetical protein
MAQNPYTTEHERNAWDLGYDFAADCVRFNAPTLGEEYFSESEGCVMCDKENARGLHQSLAFEAESYARCYSPWEQYASEINSLDEWKAEEAWEAYDKGVAARIFHDLESYDLRDYGAVYRVDHDAFCGLACPEKTFDDESDARACVAATIRRARRDGLTVRRLEAGKWEILSPDDAAMVSDMDGLLTLTFGE